MEWLLVNPHIHNIFASLGCQVGDQYVAHPNCQVTLDHILKKLLQEDRNLRTFRRAIVFSNLIKKDLLQLLIAKTDDRGIIDKTIKLFAELTTPVENLLPVDVMSKTDAGRTTILELNWLLFSAKESFLEPKATQRVLDVMQMLLDSGVEQCDANEDTLTDCIVLIGNILRVPESRSTGIGNSVSYQNRLIWNLFCQKFDKLLINLATRPQSGKWKIGIVQLVVILFKDQQEVLLQKMLHQWSEMTFICESSEDNESNTSPPDHDSRTSDPTSDSSDNSTYDVNMVQMQNHLEDGKCSPAPQKMQCCYVRKPFNRAQCQGREIMKHQVALRSESMFPNSPMQMESVDSGCETPGKNVENVSTSSNDESPERKAKPVHQKPGNMMHKQRQPATKPPLSPKKIRELKMRKLYRRALNDATISSDSILYGMNLGHKNPTNEDISQILKEFTVDFLLSAYACIVDDLWRQILDNRENFIDPSHFFWLMTYFLKFALQLELDYDCIRPVLSRDVVTFLVYQGVFLCEQCENSRLHSDFDMTARLRKLHLVVTALREIMLALKAYSNVPYINKESKQLVSQLLSDICEMEDLRNLLVMLLRQYNPDIHCRSYLIDLVCTNHILIDCIDRCSSTDIVLLQTHLKQFTAIDIMKQYGNLLGSFQENGPVVNECIFTMMHHVSGELDSLSSLFQPCIIRSFTLIYENRSPLLEDWSDLIEHVLNQFITSTKHVRTQARPNIPVDESPYPLVNREWSREDCDSLFWYFVQSANCSDPVGNIIQLYSDSGVLNKTRIGLIEQLLKQDIICDSQFNKLMTEESIVIIEEAKRNDSTNKEVEYLKSQILSEGMESLIIWLQKELIKACHAKLSLLQKTEWVVEATPFHYAANGEAIPLVPWNCEQYSAMQSPAFLLFLHKLGFLLPADTGHSFARIPKTWLVKTMFNLATKLGPVPEEWMKFDPNDRQTFENVDEMRSTMLNERCAHFIGD